MEPYVVCDVEQIPISNSKWLERPISNGMEQVRKLLRMVDHSGELMASLATNFTCRRIQPSKERVHPRFVFLERCPRRLIEMRPSVGS